MFSWCVLVLDNVYVRRERILPRREPVKTGWGTDIDSLPFPSPLHSQDEIELYQPPQCISISPKTNGAENRMGNQRFVSESSRGMRREEQAASL